jgi:hypothetical protein
MKLRLTVLLALLLTSVHAQPAPVASEPDAVVIEGLSERVYRYAAMMSARKSTDAASARNLANHILADDRIDEAEARLIAALAGEQFSILLRPGPGKDYKPAEVRYAGKLSEAARAALRETGPLDYQAVLAKPDPAGLVRLAGWLNANAERRAGARAWLAGRAAEEQAREPRHANGEWGHYRVFVNALYEQLKPVTGADGLTLRRWAFEALLLHDRQQGDTVPDFLYSYFLDGISEGEAKRAATAAIEAIAPQP